MKDRGKILLEEFAVKIPVKVGVKERVRIKAFLRPDFHEVGKRVQCGVLGFGVFGSVPGTREQWMRILGKLSALAEIVFQGTHGASGGWGHLPGHPSRVEESRWRGL